MTRQEWAEKNNWLPGIGAIILPSEGYGWNSYYIGDYTRQATRIMARDGQIEVLWDDWDEEHAPLMIFVVTGQRPFDVAVAEVDNLKYFFGLRMRFEVIEKDDNARLGEVISPTTRKFDWGNVLG